MEPTKVMGRRVVASIIDGLVLGAINLGLFFAMAEKDVAQKVLSGERTADATAYGNITINDTEWSIVGGRFMLYLAIVLAVFALVDWVLQGLKGWTPGKLVMGIRTVKADGTPPGIGKAITRWFLWLADGFPYFIYGLVGFIVAMTNDKRQRIGDKVADTYVVKAGAMGQPVDAPAPAAGAPAPSV